MRHVLICRKDLTSPSFIRSDKFGSQWVAHGTEIQTIRTAISMLIRDIAEAPNAIAATISSCRDGKAFPDPDNASIPSGVTVLVAAPINSPAQSQELNALRQWVVIHWSGADYPPATGERFAQKTLHDWLDRFFSEEQFELWNKPKGGSEIEVWIRPGWDVKKMFPQLFPGKEELRVTAPTLDVPKERDSNDVSMIPLMRNGNPVVRVAFAPKTRWRFFGVDGNEVARNFLTEDEATLAMNKYIQENNLRFY